MTLSDGINSDKSSLPVNDQNQKNEDQHNPDQRNPDTKEEKQHDDRSALKGNYRPSSKKPGKESIKKTGDQRNEESKQLGDETEIDDETTI